MLIDGRKIAEEILVTLRERPHRKFLAGVLIGNNAASESFQKIKKRTAQEIGVDYRIYHLDGTLGADELRAEVGRIAHQNSCGGVIVQLPLPEHLNAQYILNAIPPEKDPDVLSERTLGAFYTGRNKVVHPAAAVVKEIMERAGYDPSSGKATVIGKGFLIGRPVATWLMPQVRELEVLGRESDLGKVGDADLVILGTGSANVISASVCKPGAGVIDFGYALADGKIAGDLDISGGTDHLAFYTPTPGGTGPILVAKLFQNFDVLNSEK